MMENLPNLTVTFLIEYESKFLLISRGKAETNFPSLWAFPGGKVEIGETVVDTIRREIFEETNLELMDEACFLDTYFFGKTVGVAFLVIAKTDKVILSNEINDFVWVKSLEDLKMYKCIPGIFNHLERAIEMLDKKYFDSLEKMNLTENKYLNK